ncbi:MurR/RpiR family transcriptional regulator [Cupriavidus metallidurans]|jgi:RpiR family transcriptional regulator, carbohydrate utilization regulator|uniref:MurR/RpiR family transcriptional regulator n=1 Tax=Cupriavidus metallidurans TaxID=119219 RepID=UPI0007638F09|nr:SIS domain-containing protein [Cupriavidus metallidurans]KWW36738.1 HTH-type transcriptional regulator HexR [Cupriavidus metallidurans]
MRDRILAVYDSLRPSERRLADYVARHGASVIRLTMPELADRAGVSQPTIARFCAALGYDGFKEFKLQFAQNVGGGTPFVHQDVEADDRPADIAGKVFDRTIATLMSVRNALSADQIEHGIRLLAGARRIEFYGCGNSGIVALDIQHKFFRLGIPTTAYSDPHVFSMSAALLRPGDVAVLVSNSGRTWDMLTAATLARSSGASVLALTHSGSPLARLADVCVFSDVEEDSEVYTPMTSRICHLVLGDVLAAGVALDRADSVAAGLQRAKAHLRERRIAGADPAPLSKTPAATSATAASEATSQSTKPSRAARRPTKSDSPASKTTKPAAHRGAGGASRQ